jgi:hypothetical protein
MSEPKTELELRRAAIVAETPRWYSPSVHLLGPSLFGLSLCVLAASRLEGVRWFEWITIPAFWAVSNFIEWHAHRDLLHTQKPWAKKLFDRHAVDHHGLFIESDMAIRDKREWRLVLLPGYAVLLLLFLLMPFFAGAWFAGLPNVALLFMMTGSLYVLSYEWLHLSYHLDPESFIGSLGIIRCLRRHHSVHHNPRFMKRWNMNVTIPFWDWVRGTTADEEVQAEAPRGS